MMVVADPFSTKTAAASLLDVNAAEALLARALGCSAATGRRPENVRIERCWPSGESGMQVEWSFRLGRGERHRLFGQAAPSAAKRAEGVAEPCEPVQVECVSAYLADIDVLVHAPNTDARLPQLRTCLDQGVMNSLLQSLWREQANRLERVRPEYPATEHDLLHGRLLGYRAGRRAAIAYEEPGRDCPILMGKTFRDDRGERLVARHVELNEQLHRLTRSVVQVPVPLGYLAPQHLALFLWAGGARGSGLDTLNADAHRVAGQVLAALHATRCAALPAWTPRDEVKVLERWHGFLGHIDADFAARLDDLRGGLVRARTLNGATTCTIHRDFYGAQLLHTQRGAVLLDLDTLAVGDAAVDLGNWLAHTYLDLLVRGGDSSAWAPLCRSFLESYAAHGGIVDDEALAWHFAIAACRVGMVHAYRTATGGSSDSIWNAARAVLHRPIWRCSR